MKPTIEQIKICQSKSASLDITAEGHRFTKFPNQLVSIQTVVIKLSNRCILPHSSIHHSENIMATLNGRLPQFPHVVLVNPRRHLITNDASGLPQKGQVELSAAKEPFEVVDVHERGLVDEPCRTCAEVVFDGDASVDQGQGPCVDACATGTAIGVQDL